MFQYPFICLVFRPRSTSFHRRVWIKNIFRLRHFRRILPLHFCPQPPVPLPKLLTTYTLAIAVITVAAFFYLLLTMRLCILECHARRYYRRRSVEEERRLFLPPSVCLFAIGYSESYEQQISTKFSVELGVVLVTID